MAKKFTPFDVAQSRNEFGSNFAYTLSRIHWDCFGTLTFAGTVPSPKKMYSFAFRHVRDVAKLSATPYGMLLLALRYEHGEKNGRPHFHYLLGGLKTRNIFTLVHRSKYNWKCLNGGHAVIKPYNRALAGVEYVTKCLSGGDVYEQDKFSLADEVTLSDGVYRVIRSLDQIRADTQSATQRERRCAEHRLSVAG